ncbi:corrinoid protein [Lutibacter sp. TH_r2]|uniref:cobalamin B12-binding domain-containing protein n=1 Tax=Lutibacter sp. TH_r2 TaxID=3082083 RepID=UPI002952C6C7|nr:corrinoid protein [Lutibacter sp. TH_r2]MDV7185948.1 corrinoid protein [Lutibacter sp. TH_r2]
MEELFNKISDCVEFGKINKVSPYPPNMKDQDGADELTVQALEQGASAREVLEKGLILGMEKVGVKFRENKVFVPQVLMSAKAMNTAMNHLKPLFAAGNTDKKGVFVIGTVAGDLHDIGKNLVSMIVEGNGYEVIDLGTDVPAQKFIDTINEFPNAIIGLSSLLTTTMASMENIVKEIKAAHPNQKVTIGGAPITQEFCDQIGADNFSADPQGVVEFMNNLKMSA